MIATILSVSSGQFRERVLFLLTDGANTFGPFLERRPIGANHQVFVDARAASTLDSLQAAEIAYNLAQVLAGGTVVLSLRWTTNNQNAAAVRQAYQSATAWECVKIAKYINSLGLTDNQLKALFGINDAQLASLKTKIANQVAEYNSVNAEVGS